MVMTKLLKKLNLDYNTNLRLGEFIIQSKNENGYWSNDFGWCSNKDGATGYTQEDLTFYRNKDGSTKPVFFGITDAEFVEYKKTKDFNS